jgi:hypothetical protein
MSHRSKGHDTSQVKRHYYLNLYSTNAEIRKSPSGLKNSVFTWNIRNLELGTIAEVSLVQIASNNASDFTTYCIRCNDCYQDGFDGFNQTSAVLYLGNGLKNPEYPTEHKLISDNLCSITLVITDDITASTAIYGGINTNISFAVVLQITDFVDSLQNF